ncbi:MAG: hypothetical protein HUK06_01525 [Bacteroidaceae bacterium]|nr:hypothetical protein [Bacteroidaceae bacterium]
MKTTNRDNVTLYLVRTYKAYMASECVTQWRTNDSHNDAYYGEETLDNADFILPQGYSVHESRFGEIYFKQGNTVFEEIITGEDGNPYVTDYLNGCEIKLERVSNNVAETEIEIEIPK